MTAIVTACGPADDSGLSDLTDTELGETTRETPWVLIGIDGADRLAVERLWSEGRLPNLRAIADRGMITTLETAYGKSPVIWTTVATGKAPTEHGIEDFVVHKDGIDVPVTSTMRRVAALWNMVSRGHRTVSVLGWWATWPAEIVNGVMVADRALRDPPRGIYPASYFSNVKTREATLRKGREHPFGTLDFASRDHLIGDFAIELAGSFDLTMVYFRTVDIVSHRDWGYFEDAENSEETTRTGAARVEAAYEAVDDAIGKIIAAVGMNANVMIVSDHGFESFAKPKQLVSVDLAALLERLGYLVRDEAGDVDPERSELVPYRAPRFKREKMMRFGGAAGQDRRAIRRRLAADLEAVVFAGGEVAFRVRAPTDAERASGAELTIVTRRASKASLELRIDGVAVDDVVTDYREITGTHTPSTHGVLLAAGPDIVRGATLTSPSIHGVTPTVLYGLGLPVAEDFLEEAWLPLFSETFRGKTTLRRIASWGGRPSSDAVASDADEEAVEQLRALGYLD